MTDLSQYDDDVVTQAFWLQRKIKQKGTPGINFSGSTKHYWERHADDVTKDAVMRNLRSDGF